MLDQKHIGTGGSIPPQVHHTTGIGVNNILRMAHDAAVALIQLMVKDKRLMRGRVTTSESEGIKELKIDVFPVVPMNKINVKLVLDEKGSVTFGGNDTENV